MANKKTFGFEGKHAISDNAVIDFPGHSKD
jgi:hypothetical protein